MGVVNLSQLNACTLDAKLARTTPAPEPADPTDWNAMFAAVSAAQHHLPLIYRRQFAQPFLDTLGALTEADRVSLQAWPCCAGVLRPLYDIALAILQRQDSQWSDHVFAFQEVVSDLYDGFLSAEDRRGVKPPDRATIAPLVKWGRLDPSSSSAENEPYTFAARATAAFGVKTAIVNLPATHARQGLVYWAMLGHETCGHDILQADMGLLGELREHVGKAILAGNPGAADHGAWWVEYWSRRLEETASDLLGILNMGPAAVVAFIAGFRGLLAAKGYPPNLRTSDGVASLYPCDVLRGYVGAETVRVLGFGQRDAWANELARLVDEDGGDTLTLAGRPVARDLARDMARTVARTLAKTKLKALEDQALIDIQDWRDSDQRIAERVIAIFQDPSILDRMDEGERSRLMSGTYAAHVVAAAVTAAAAGRGEIQSIQDLMVRLLVDMHRNNPAWCPLQVAYPGDMSMRLAFPSFDEAPPAATSETTKPAARRPRKNPGKKTKSAAATTAKERPPR